MVVVRAGATSTVTVTEGAGSQLSSPGWVAVSTQLPAPVGVTVAAFTVHAPPAASSTGSPEGTAAAVTEKGSSPSSTSSTGSTSMTCGARAMTRVAVTGAGSVT